MIVEGAGGWQVPLNASMTLADWVAEKQWPVILVVGIRLGCINHALLTQLDILQKKNPLLGWVANVIDSETSNINEIIEYLELKISAPLLGKIPHIPQIEQKNIHQFLKLAALN